MHITKILFFPVAGCVLGAAGLYGCGHAADADADALRTTSEPVIDGVTDPDTLGVELSRLEKNAALAQLTKKSVVSTTYRQGCSATLIGDRVAVMAGHCVVYNQDEWIHYGAEPEVIFANKLFYGVGDDINQPECILATESVHLHPDIQIVDERLDNDVAIALLAESSLASCGLALPLSWNRETLDSSLVGTDLLQGGYGSIDGTYDFSPVRYWSLLDVSEVADGYVEVNDMQSGFPTYGDSGSGVLLRYPDGGLRNLGVCSVGGYGVMEFQRLDQRNDFFDSVVPPEYVCGAYGEEGTCVRDAIVSCTDGRFTAVDCRDQGKACVTGGDGVARCDECACDVDALCDGSCACDPDCPCACDTSEECEEHCACDEDCVVVDAGVDAAGGAAGAAGTAGAAGSGGGVAGAAGTGGNEADSGAPAGMGGEAGAAPAPGNSDAASSDDGGCSIGSTGKEGGSGTPWVVVVAAVLAWMRQRPRNHTRDAAPRFDRD